MRNIFAYSIGGLLVAVILSFYFGFIALGCFLLFVALTLMNAISKISKSDHQIHTHRVQSKDDFDRFSR
ncbi:hypothetical protein BRE01_34690 [Brevibacillus reuszeri]|uniref:Uncharacterized protein n=1 Tax=Brevibacillus reuszeri TaxID=54915 RepID=A0A0K9YPV4_9BACL|nr:hypothetical protein ADS79_17955 [Brevibacillus reuszeri]GED69767.1 hypothetical protein BRE01_34690 [Brevibacillus reuszeri]